MLEKINKLLGGRFVDSHIKACLCLLLAGIGLFMCLITAILVWKLR